MTRPDFLRTPRMEKEAYAVTASCECSFESRSCARCMVLHKHIDTFWHMFNFWVTQRNVR